MEAFASEYGFPKREVLALSLSDIAGYLAARAARLERENGPAAATPLEPDTHVLVEPDAADVQKMLRGF